MRTANLLLLSLSLLVAACSTSGDGRRRSATAAPDAAPTASDAKAAAQALAGELGGAAPRTVPDHPLSRFPDGTTMRLSEARGSVVLLDVWATWCKPCVESLPEYDALAQRFAGRGLVVYAMSVDEDPSQIARFVEETRIALPILMDDQDQRVSRALGLRGVPTTYLIDRAGTIRSVIDGYDPALLQALEAQIEQLLAEAP